MVRRRVLLPALVVVMVTAGACSGGDDGAAPLTQPSATAAVTATSPSPPAVASTASPSASPSASSAAPTTGSATTAPPTTIVVEDTGVPGLDSDDAFCAAWSRFGGSWQVAIVAAFGGGSEASTRLEVIGAPVVGDAYDAIFDAWPGELAAEQQVVADEYFGAFQRRSADALAALDRAGATEADLDALGDVWVAALAGRDPSNPVIEVALPADLEPLVEVAAADFASQRTPLVEDPSMVITASTPLTDEYLATACPDQGAITGSDVVEG